MLFVLVKVLAWRLACQPSLRDRLQHKKENEEDERKVDEYEAENHKV